MGINFLLSLMVAVVVLVLVIELAYYTLFLPEQTDEPLKPRRLDSYIATCIYVIAHILSPLRLPLALIPYLTKSSIMLVTRPNLNTLKSEVVRLVGDFVNVGFTTWLLVLVIGPPTLEPLMLLLYAPVGAEYIRLLSERGQMMFSGGWQLLPHRRFALALKASPSSRAFLYSVSRLFVRYCNYYALSDEERAQYILLILKRRASYDEDLSRKLEYVYSFRIVEGDFLLLAGKIRDVANGEVFISRRWTNDPWLMIGMAMRRSPWIFDPRYLQRPFYYRTQSARLVAMLMFKHARYCPPFMIYQFGHEIKDARYRMFFSTLHYLGIHIEGQVRADGTYAFDPLLRWFKGRVGIGIAEPELRPLWTDEEVLADVARRCEHGEWLSAEAIAEQYTYPRKYVEEVLSSKI